MNFISRLLVTLSIVLLVGSCEMGNLPIYENADANIDERVKDLLSRMTQEEKFWQLFMIPGDLSEGKEQYKIA